MNQPVEIISALVLMIFSLIITLVVTTREIKMSRDKTIVSMFNSRGK